jgi:2-hydroxy-3-keto-5-methylthiopentenyl-1-phosphate phosphatase
MTADARPPAAPPEARPLAAPPDERPLGRLLAFLDYDGTATTRECIEVVLQGLVGDAWRPIEDEARAGRIGHAEALDRQIGLVDVPRAQLLGAMAACAEPEPGLAEFLTALRAGGGRAIVVSAGFREVIEAVWRRHRLPQVELVASELAGAGPDGAPPYGVGFSPRLGDCPRCGPRACKAAVLRELRRPGDTVWVFGDGASDLCPAREADLVFARDHLAERCAAEGLPWRALDFAAARRALAGAAT